VHLVRRTSQQQAPIGEPQASTGSLTAPVRGWWTFV
jgi:hypothetical protein